MYNRVAFLSVHPHHVVKILGGEKRLEFRRSWAAQPIEMLIIYATAPVQRIVATAEVRKIVVGSRTMLWKLAKEKKGGITREELFAYLAGKTKAVAIELSKVQTINDPIDPKILFGHNFRAPQSFRYMQEKEYLKLDELIRRRYGHNLSCGCPRRWKDQLL